jgi:hypothetical protein
MANKQNFASLLHFIILLHSKIWLTYQCPSSWPVVIKMKKTFAGTWKKNVGCWPVQMNGNKFATGKILGNPVEVVKGRILAG